MGSRGRPRFLVPEVVQTSSMDCGPAALKCLLEGFGLNASYGRLREACQTDVDGTSIDTLEDFANDVGLNAEQILLPVDHVLTSAAAVLPAIVVVRQPGQLLNRRDADQQAQRDKRPCGHLLLEVEVADPQQQRAG